VPSVRIRLPTEELREGLARIRREFEVPDAFPPEAEAEAERVASGASGATGEAPADGRADRRDLPLLTIDPPGSRDLDQALSIERLGDGFRVRYGISDLAAFVRPGGAVDVEAWHRGLTLYLPDRRAPLHPAAISEGAASLLPERDRPALLWTIDLDSEGRVVDAGLERAVVRSRRAATYEQAQAEVGRDPAGGDGTLELLREVGLRRRALERERGGISLDLPTQEVVRVGRTYRFRAEPMLAAERWNAQISLLAGHCAAEIMVGAGVGILRTLPPVGERAIGKLRRIAAGLGVEWPDGEALGDVVRRADDRTAVGAAFLTQATHMLRGASYEVIAGTQGTPPTHGALNMIYAHVTAPLRRLVDRYANEVTLAICAGGEPPAWAVDALPALPEAMAEADRQADAVEAAVINLAETLVLSGREGQVFQASVVDVQEDRATIQLTDPPVVTKMRAEGLTLGAAIELRLVSADPETRRLEFEPA
jgi:exoribonuclease R